MRGARRDGLAIRVYVKVKGKQRERRFPLGTSKEKIANWRDEMRLKLRRRATRVRRGSLAADVEHYLALESVMGLASHGSLTCELQAWVDLYGDKRRDDLTRAKARYAKTAEIEDNVHKIGRKDGLRGLATI
jgi:hypothetical protein